MIRVQSTVLGKFPYSDYCECKQVGRAGQGT